MVESTSDIELTNNPQLLEITTINLGRGFTLAHFIVYLFRFAVIHFEYNNVKTIPEDYSQMKQLLSFLQKLEISEASRRFL